MYLLIDLKLTGKHAIKKKGGQGVLFTSSMEKDTARKKEGE